MQTMVHQHSNAPTTHLLLPSLQPTTSISTPSNLDVNQTSSYGSVVVRSTSNTDTHHPIHYYANRPALEYDYYHQSPRRLQSSLSIVELNDDQYTTSTITSDHRKRSSISSVASINCCYWCVRWLCCCCPGCWTNTSNVATNSRGTTVMPWSSRRRRSQDDKTLPKPTTQISDEVYQKIRQVDQQSSTLTTAGVQGFSARIIEKSEYRQDLPDGTTDILVCQTVEIIKKPGQSLGLYLREGDGVNRATGVFASRFGENSELQRYGDIICPGDEILSINNVDVARMGIDDVVLILSIPRRLVLVVRFVKHRRRPAWLDITDGDNDLQQQQQQSKPIVVFKKAISPIISREDSRESGFADFDNPTPTANTSLGQRARQQLVEMQQQQNSSNVDNNRRHHNPTTTIIRPTTIMSPRQHFALHQPRVLDSHGEPLPSDTVSRTACVPPPKLYHPTAAVRRTESLMQQPSTSTYHHHQQQSNLFSPRSVASDSMMDYQRSFYPASSSSSRPIPPPKPAILRRPIGIPSSHYMQQQHAIDDSYRSNSLPRRPTTNNNTTTTTRSVKWRNDVIGGIVSSSGGVGPAGADLSTDSDGAISAPELIMSPTYGRRRAAAAAAGGGGTISRDYRPSPSTAMSQGRTIDDIFSAQEYRNWAGHDRSFYVNDNSYHHPPRQSRWSHTFGDEQQQQQQQNASLPTSSSTIRSSSLPPRSVLAQYISQLPSTPSIGTVRRLDHSVYDRLHVSPLMNRRLPTALRPAGPGFDVDKQPMSSLTGMLVVHIVEGRALRMSDKQKAFTDEMYCVLEVNQVHRARTGVSTAQQRFRWQETFEIDVWNARDIDLFVYSWHPQYRHKLCHKGSLKLLEAFIVDRLNGDRTFALNLEPRGQLLVRIGFHNMSVVFRRQRASQSNAYFGVDLATLVEREKSGQQVPIVLRRLIDEIEVRGVDSTGLYTLGGSVEKKRALREMLESSPLRTDLSADAVPDTNVLTAVLKDYLRELPEPIIHNCIYELLVDAATVSLPNDRQGNTQLMLRALDCMSSICKSTLMTIMDHLKTVSTSEPHNGLNTKRMSHIFGPLLMCTSQHRQSMPADIAKSVNKAGLHVGRELNPVDTLDAELAARTFHVLIELWPSRVSSSESSGSDRSGARMSNNGGSNNNHHDESVC